MTLKSIFKVLRIRVETGRQSFLVYCGKSRHLKIANTNHIESYALIFFIVYSRNWIHQINISLLSINLKHFYLSK